MNPSSRLFRIHVRRCAAGGALALTSAVMAFASDAPSARLTQHELRPIPGADINVRSVVAAHRDVIDEINVGRPIILTDVADARGRFLMVAPQFEGSIPTLHTQATLEQDQKIDLASLPLSHAIKTVTGDGSRKMAIFADPYCPYCKALERTIAQLDNVTVYTFVFPILQPESRSMSEAIWCAEDPSAAWRAWMLGGTRPPAKGLCVSAPVASNLALAEGLGIHATPTTIFESGRRQVGALPLDEFDAALNLGKL